jgi:D-alanyl-lipoteichoic acid acyltransferase DltB (MBOAT superfamily)
MLFPTTDFAIFFGVVFLAHWLLQPTPTRWKVFMIAASYVFYAWWDWHYVWLLALSSVLAHAGALAVRRTRKERRPLVTGVAVAAVLAPLVYFKYYDFFLTNVANGLHRVGIDLSPPLIGLIFPVGLSFYTFMAVSYVVDVYREEIETVPALDLFVYLSFFPHLVAGPIVRGSELLPQIRTRRDPRRLDVGRAAHLIFGGLFKKVVISSFLATAIVDPVFRDPAAHSSLEILVAVYGFAAQIYADFSGYTDIAIGVALLLGFHFPQNFDRPYTARSLQDFWRRWHITLSRWLRDYLYIPLGGNRRGRVRTTINIILTMVLGGLWHGAQWTFVVWGGIHGLGQAIGHRRRERRTRLGLPPLDDRPGAVWRQRIVTFHVVCLGWVFFRADSIGTAITMLIRLLTAWGPSPLVTPLVLLALLVGLGTQYLPHDAGERVRLVLSRLRPVALGVALGFVLFLITSMGPQGVAPFIYYKF